MEDTSPAGTSAWSAGMRLIGQRELTPEERGELQQDVRSCWLRGFLALLGMPLVYGLALYGLSFTYELRPPSFAFRCLLAVAPVVAILLWTGQEWRRRGWKLSKDAAMGI